MNAVKNNNVHQKNELLCKKKKEKGKNEGTNGRTLLENVVVTVNRTVLLRGCQVVFSTTDTHGTVHVVLVALSSYVR